MSDVEPDPKDLPDKPSIDVPKEAIVPPTDQEENDLADDDFMDLQTAKDDDTVDNAENDS